MWATLYRLFLISFVAATLSCIAIFFSFDGLQIFFLAMATYFVANYLDKKDQSLLADLLRHRLEIGKMLTIVSASFSGFGFVGHLSFVILGFPSYMANNPGQFGTSMLAAPTFALMTILFLYAHLNLSERMATSA